VFLVITASWFTVYRAFCTYDSPERFLDDVFSGFRFIAFMVLSISGLFYLRWPGLSLVEGRFAGPFSSANYFGLCLGVLLVGLCYQMLYRDGVRRTTSSHRITVHGLLLVLVLTMSRGAMLFGLGSFMALHLFVSRRAFILLLVSVAGLIVMLCCVHAQTYEHIVSRANDLDSGRMTLLLEQYDRAKRRCVFGHGLGVSAITNFGPYEIRGLEISSHNYMMSTFYDTGILGCIVAAGLLSAVIYRYLIQLRTRRKTSHFALTVICMALLYAAVENIFWNGNGVSDLLVMAIVCMSTRAEDGATALQYG
jgi:hypothetical protein